MLAIAYRLRAAARPACLLAVLSAVSLPGLALPAEAQTRRGNTLQVVPLGQPSPIYPGAYQTYPEPYPPYGGQTLTPMQGRVVTVPSGTPITVSLATPLSSRDSQPGSPVVGQVIAPVVVNGLTAIPAGSQVQGTVVQAQPAGRFRNRESSLSVLFTQVMTPSGQTLPIQARLSSQNLMAANAQGRTGLSPVGRATVGTLGGAAGGAALGTGLGAIVGSGVQSGKGGKGAGLGAIYGTAIGAGTGLVGALATQPRGQDIVVQPGQSFTLMLESPVSVTP